MTEHGDNLAKLFELQEKLLPLLGVDTSQEYGTFSSAFDKAIFGLMSEVGECADLMTISTKPWKAGDATKDAAWELHKTYMKGELTDVLFFLLEAFILMGVDADELMESYLKKRAILLVRLETGKKE